MTIAKPVLLFLLFSCAVAHAQIFSCKDAAGRMITSDRPMPECADRMTRELSNHGFVRREIPPPLTPEQRRQKQLDEEKRIQDAALAQEQKQRDRAILLRYRNEGDINAAREREIGQLKERIARENAAIEEAEKQAGAVQKEAKSGRHPPSMQTRVQLETGDKIIKESRNSIAQLQADTEAVKTKYDGTLLRYRELTGAGTKAPADAGGSVEKAVSR